MNIYVTQPVLGFDTTSAMDKVTAAPPAQQLTTQQRPTTPVAQPQIPASSGGRAPENIPTGNLSPIPPTTGNAPTGGPVRSQGTVESQTPPQTQDSPSSPIVTVNTVVKIGGSILGPNLGTATVIANGQVFTINPSQIIAPGTTIVRPGITSGVAVTGTLTPTVVNGITVAVGSSIAVIGSSTYTIGPGATPTTTVVNGQTVSVGPSGVRIGSTTLYSVDNPTSPPDPKAVLVTQVATIGSVRVTEIGSTVMIGSNTYTLGPQASPTTVVVSGQTFSLGPSGVGTPSTTLFYPPPNGALNPTQIITAAGITFSEISSSLVVIGSSTFTLGTQATPTTEVVNGVTVSIGPGGIGVGGSTTLTPPPAQHTQAVTAGGITFSEIGSSLVVIGSSTFTVGPGATPTTDIYNGQTISIGPGGVGIGGSTTIAPPTQQTQAITAGGITFSEIGSSLVVIGSSTFTIGPSATPTTDVFDGQTISIGPSGVGLASTTIPYVGPSSTLLTTNGAPSGKSLSSWHGLALCVLIGGGLLI